MIRERKLKEGKRVKKGRRRRKGRRVQWLRIRNLSIINSVS